MFEMPATGFRVRNGRPSAVTPRQGIARWLIRTAAALVIVAVSALHAHAFSRIIVFGDSLSDSGNVYFATGKLIPAAPYHEGRFSNGLNYADLLASNLGLSLRPVLDGGTNYAVGGAKTASFPDQLPYNFLSQVAMFRSQIALGTTEKPDEDALYVVFIGSNDMLDVVPEALDDPANQAAIVGAAVEEIVGDIEKGLQGIRDEGAVNILVLYLANLARTPRYVQKEAASPGTFAVVTAATLSFNHALDDMLDSFSDLNIIRFNTFELFEQAISNGATLGLTDVITACYTGDGSFMGGGTVCSDPAGYAFWDTIHPSARSHSILAQELNITLHGWFGDVCSFYWAYDHIQKLSAANVTRGCGNGFYCPEDLVTRAEMAVFIERIIKEDAFLPPPAVGIFVDVPTDYWASAWIEQFFQDGITAGCGENTLQYCPEQPLTRAEMAVFLLRAKHAGGYSPPEPGGIFADVPKDYWAAGWIEQLYLAGITTGCGENPLRYCPDDEVTRAQMAAFLVRTFGL
ncbi:SGNH/GDSL hydrolase family protein [Desulfoferrobacter suflitae]|uniref:SGNH/GDSL hydrolase family protein n=1 Tax=Desulfoferrobacter suflitae TaxID=2865782 RepID=UPI002164CD69|nr:SGNH/GDSL hydrolase family protein [Desulfoferrobacter suflitae]MCK8601293.1 SGNH/GDSL hydrolase family protein [Desulfoferrobacter suflitae]